MPIPFHYTDKIRAEYPGVSTRVLSIVSINPETDVSEIIRQLYAVASTRLSVSSEGEFPEIKAWRGVFAKMGLKPTQYRCAAESLLRRFRNEGQLPFFHPLVDVCNAFSMAYAIPIAVFDLAMIDGFLEVRHATGSEVYETFSGEIEKPDPGEVIFADIKDRAHARRWTHRQSRYSAIHSGTTEAFIVAEAFHSTAERDLADLIERLKDVLIEFWPECKVEVV